MRTSTALLVLLLLAAASSRAAAQGSAAPPASSAAPTARDLPPEKQKTGKRPILPKPDEWMKKAGRSSVRVVQARPEELPLLVYTEPDFQVLGIDPNRLCAEPRREPTFEIIFGSDGKVEALDAVEPNPCPQLTAAWSDSITSWRWDMSGPNEPQIPALIRVTVHFGAKPKPVPPTH